MRVNADIEQNVTTLEGNSSPCHLVSEITVEQNNDLSPELAKCDNSFSIRGINVSISKENETCSSKNKIDLAQQTELADQSSTSVSFLSPNLHQTLLSTPGKALKYSIVLFT